VTKRALKSAWRLAYRQPGEDRHELPLEASVPGNVELDLSRAGLLPADLFFGENILAVRDWERAEWWYSCPLPLSPEELAGSPELVFQGVDGDAEYYLNGQLIGTSANSLVEHRVELAGAARAGDNELVVHLWPPHPPAAAAELVPLWAMREPQRQDSVWVRKPAHAYGWDIMPRALSAGIWRPVELVTHAPVEVARLYPATVSVVDDVAELSFYYELRGELGPGPGNAGEHRLVVSGQCESSSFRFEAQVAGPVGVVRGEVSSPQLWWPRGYGHPDLYQLTTELQRDGRTIARRQDRTGIRVVEVVRRPAAPDARGDFHFVVNGSPVYCRGTNWVPLDPFHSRDADLLGSRLEVLWRSNSNMVRGWGGNVYEGDEFFDWCDEHGVMVWQDFSFACAIYPQTDAFFAVAREEVASVVRRLRHHPSVVLWCGDNEVDQIALGRGIAPRANVLTRRVLAETVSAEDPHRPYLASSPYVGPDEEVEALRTRDLRWLPEAHLWGSRDYYKSAFYQGSTAAFVSEIGFMGIPQVESMRKFLDEDKLWPHDNRQWLVHGTDPTVDFNSRFWWRTVMTLECVRIFFGEVPADLADAVAASQIVQAEGFKYAIESGRQAKWDRTGVLWWNLIDGWPQISDAVVDWYLGEKIAFEVIAASQRPLVLIVGEPDGHHLPLLACNDTRRHVSGSYVVTKVEDGAKVLSENYGSPANETVQIGTLELPPDPSMLLVEWQDDDGPARNHYLVGAPPFDFKTLRSWYEEVLGRTV
jgi:beta-mannosidase